MKIAIVNSSQMIKYARMDAGFFVMLDEIKEDVAKDVRIPVIQDRLVCRERRGSLKGYSHGCLLSIAISISII